MQKLVSDIAIPASTFTDDERRLWLLLKTDVNTSSMKLMGRLAALPGVREVHMTEGEWSFVVEVSAGEGKAKEIAHRLSRIPGVKSAKGAVSAFSQRGGSGTKDMARRSGATTMRSASCAVIAEGDLKPTVGSDGRWKK